MSTTGLPSAESTTREPAITFESKGVPPPSTMLIDRNDRLYIRHAGTATGATITVHARLLLPNGEIVPNSFSVAPSTNRSFALTTFNLSNGFLLSMTAFVEGVVVGRGEVYAEIGILRGVAGAGQVFQALVADYVESFRAISYPGGPMRSSIEGRGNVRSITGTDPAANAESSETVPTNARWRLLAWVIALVTDANAANRITQFTIDDGTDIVFAAQTQVDITASLTVGITAQAGGSIPGGRVSRNVVGLPELALLEAGFRIRTVTTALQAGDNYGAPQLWVEEWLVD